MYVRIYYMCECKTYLGSNGARLSLFSLITRCSWYSRWSLHTQPTDIHMHVQTCKNYVVLTSFPGIPCLPGGPISPGGPSKPCEEWMDNTIWLYTYTYCIFISFWVAYSQDTILYTTCISYMYYTLTHMLLTHVRILHLLAYYAFKLPFQVLKAMATTLIKDTC